MLTEQKGIQVDKFYPPTDWQYSFPAGYTRLEYLESTGTQYIDTGIKATNNTRIDLDCFYDTRKQADLFFGSYSYNNNIPYDSFAIGHNTVNNTTRLRAIYGTQSYINDNFSYNTKHIFSLNKNNFYVDNVLEYSFEAENDFTTTHNVLLFSGWVNGNIVNYLSRMKVYTCQIYDNDVLVRNFVPAKRNSDNKPGMLDLANVDASGNYVFYTNAGTGEFVMGTELYSNNSQIDIRQKNNTNFVEKYKFNENNELVWANPNLYLTGKVNYTKVGSPTITDNVVSGFSDSNYLTLSQLPEDSTEIQVDFTLGNSKSGVQNIMTFGLFSMTIANNYLAMWDNKTSAWKIIIPASNLVVNNHYIIKVIKNANNLSFYYSQDGGNFINSLNFTSTNPYNSEIRIGNSTIANRYFKGSINLTNTYIKINDKLWFYGKNYTSENYAPVPAGLNYNNTTTPSIGYVDIRTQEFIPAPTDGIKYSQTRDIKVIPPEDNTITLLYGVASDFSKYSLFGLLAQVSSGSYDVYIDDVLYATTASATQTDIDFSALGAEYVPIGTCTTPEELVLHKIVIKPSTSGETITTFRCRRTTGATGTQLQGILWANLQLENILSISNGFGVETSYNNRILYALTAKNNKIIVRSTSTNTTGIYSMFARCDSLIYSPVLEYETKNYVNGVYLTFDQTKLKRVTIKNNPSIDMTIIRNAQQLEKIDIENPISLRSGTAAGNNAQNAYKLELFPKYETETRTCDNINMYYATSLYPTKINDSTNKLRDFLRIYGSSTYPMRGLRGLKVSNEAPFTGDSPQINVSYTGLDRDALVELFGSMPGYMKLDKVGTPTIDSNGIASGFSDSDYLTTPAFTPGDKPWEIVCKFTTGSTILESGIITGLGTNDSVAPFYLRTNGNLVFFLSSTGTNWNIVSDRQILTVQANTTYIIKLEFTGNAYNAYSFENGEWVLKNTLTSTTKIYGTIPLVFGNNRGTGLPFNGSIDLKNSYITINNARYQFQLPDDTTTRAINITAATGNNLTQNDTNNPVTIDNNGIASGFSSTSYLKIPNYSLGYSNFEMIFRATSGKWSDSSFILFTQNSGPSNTIQFIQSRLWISWATDLGLSSNLNFVNQSFVTGTFYYIKFSRKDNIASLAWGTDGINYPNILTQDIGNISLGSGLAQFGYNGYKSSAGYSGSIDLENTYIKVGQNYIMKGQILDSDIAIIDNRGKNWTVNGYNL